MLDMLPSELHSASATAFFSGVWPRVTLVQPSMMLLMPKEKVTKMNMATKRAAMFVVTAGMMKPTMMMHLPGMCQRPDTFTKSRGLKKGPRRESGDTRKGNDGTYK